MIHGIIRRIHYGCTDFEDYSDVQRTTMEESLESYKYQDRTIIIKHPVDVSTKITGISDIMKRIQDEKTYIIGSIDRTIENYEQMLTILDERQKIYNNACIGTLAQNSLDIVNRYNITPHDVPTANVLEFAREQASMDLEARIGGRRTRRNAKKKKKRT